jgi:predicted phosphodiesterase
MSPPRGYRWLTPELLAEARKLVDESKGAIGRLLLERKLGITANQATRILEVIRGQKKDWEPQEVEAPAPPRPHGPPKILHHLHEVRTIEELADLMSCAPREVRAQLAELEATGYPLHETSGSYWVDRDPTPAETRMELPEAGEKTVRFGFVSDTHLGSTRQQLSYLVEDYQRFADAEITTVLHIGDMLAGVNVYRGQSSDLFLHRYDDQVDYAANRYPNFPGITTVAISGNHDLAGLKSNGSDPLKGIARERSDIRYLGPYSAWLNIGSLRVYMLHPDGGQAYAKSYKLQKLAESFTGGEKPHVAICGHWHSRAYVDERNIHLFLAGCYEGQTSYEQRKLLSPVIGGGIIEIDVEGEDGFHAMTPRFFRHMVPIEGDR